METKFSKSWDEFIESKEGKQCSELDKTTFLGSTSNKYLINRLHMAFSAGWNANGQVERLVMPTEAELLPCPFCGDEAEIQIRGTKNNSMIIACINCGARVESPDIYGVTNPKHYHWNMRASS